MHQGYHEKLIDMKRRDDDIDFLRTLSTFLHAAFREPGAMVRGFFPHDLYIVPRPESCTPFHNFADGVRL